MNTPAIRDLAHDLRNLLGLVRATSADLVARLTAAGEMAELAADLDRHTRFALDVLRLLEKAEATEPIEAHLGAWAWMLRWHRRDLRLDEMTGAGRAKITVAPAIESGVALLEAIGGTRPSSAEVIDGAVVISVIGRAAEPKRLAGEFARLRDAGLRAESLGELPCRVRVTAV